MRLNSICLSPKQALQQDGYFIQRAVLSSSDCDAIRSDLLGEAERLAQDSSFGDALLEPSAKERPLDVPLHERFRKLSHLQRLEAVWNHWLGAPCRTHSAHGIPWRYYL